MRSAQALSSRSRWNPIHVGEYRHFLAAVREHPSSSTQRCGPAWAAGQHMAPARAPGAAQTAQPRRCVTKAGLQQRGGTRDPAGTAASGRHGACGGRRGPLSPPPISDSFNSRVYSVLPLYGKHGRASTRPPATRASRERWPRGAARGRGPAGPSRARSAGRRLADSAGPGGGGRGLAATPPLFGCGHSRRRQRKFERRGGARRAAPELSPRRSARASAASHQRRVTGQELFAASSCVPSFVSGMDLESKVKKVRSGAACSVTCRSKRLPAPGAALPRSVCGERGRGRERGEAGAARGPCPVGVTTYSVKSRASSRWPSPGVRSLRVRSLRTLFGVFIRALRANWALLWLGL